MESHLLTEAVGSIERNDPARLRSLLQQHPELVDAAICESGRTLLHLSAKYARIETTQLLLDSGARTDAIPAGSFFPDAKNAGDGSWTPLVEALNGEQMEVAELLAEREIVPNNLWVAVGLGRRELVESFFDSEGCVKPEAGDPGKLQEPQDVVNDAFVMACHLGRRDLIALLLDKGADINGYDHWGMTGLHYAVLKGVDLVALLIENGADARIRDWQHGSTPLGWSIHLEQNEVRDYILADCTIDITDAVFVNRLDLVKRILDAQPELLNGPEGLGEPLRKAAQMGNHAIVSLLLKRGAKANILETRTGTFDLPVLKETALGWAVTNGHDDIAELLREACAVE